MIISSLLKLWIFKTNKQFQILSLVNELSWTNGNQNTAITGKTGKTAFLTELSNRLTLSPSEETYCGHRIGFSCSLLQSNSHSLRQKIRQRLSVIPENWHFNIGFVLVTKHQCSDCFHYWDSLMYFLT